MNEPHPKTTPTHCCIKPPKLNWRHCPLGPTNESIDHGCVGRSIDPESVVVTARTGQCKMGNLMEEGGQRRRSGPDDVVVVHLLEERDLADGGGRDALVLLLEADLLERDRLVGGLVQRLVHHPVRALPDLLLLLVLQPARTHANSRTRSIRETKSKPSSPKRARSLAYLLHCVPQCGDGDGCGCGTNQLARKREGVGGEMEGD